MAMHRWLPVDGQIRLTSWRGPCLNSPRLTSGHRCPSICLCALHKHSWHTFALGGRSLLAGDLAAAV